MQIPLDTALGEPNVGLSMKDPAEVMKPLTMLQTKLSVYIKKLSTISNWLWYIFRPRWCLCATYF